SYISRKLPLVTRRTVLALSKPVWPIGGSFLRPAFAGEHITRLARLCTTPEAALPSVGRAPILAQAKIMRADHGRRRRFPTHRAFFRRRRRIPAFRSASLQGAGHFCNARSGRT